MSADIQQHRLHELQVAVELGLRERRAVLPRHAADRSRKLSPTTATIARETQLTVPDMSVQLVGRAQGLEYGVGLAAPLAREQRRRAAVARTRVHSHPRRWWHHLLLLWWWWWWLRIITQPSPTDVGTGCSK